MPISYIIVFSLITTLPCLLQDKPSIYSWLIYSIIIAPFLLLSSKDKHIQRHDFTPLLYLGIYGLIILILNFQLLSYTYLVKTLCLFLYFLYGRTIGSKFTESLFIPPAFIQSICCILQKHHILYSINPSFFITGTLGNPAPSSIIISLGIMSVTLAYAKTNSKKYRCYIIPTLAIFIYASILCNSRTGWIMVLLSISFFIKASKAHRILYTSLSAIVLTTLFYYLRPLSANARILIWRNCLIVLKEHPLFGISLDQFQHYYMFYQARYFSDNISSPLSIVANNHTSSYNTLLELLCENGIVGTLIILSLMFVMLKNKYNRPKPFLLSICYCSLFYNILDMPEISIISLFLIGAASYNENTQYCYSKKNNVRSTIVGITLCIQLTLTLLYSDLFKKTTKGIFDEADIVPQKIYSDKGLNNLLYYRPINLTIKEELFHNYPTYEKACEIASLYAKENDYPSAIEYYTLARNMIPSRISANYNLFLLYSQINEIELAKQICSQTIKQPIKRMGTLELKMLYEMNKYLELPNQ